MKTNKLLIISMLIVLAGAVPILAQSDTKEQLVVAMSEPNKPGSLEVGLVNGFIHVVGYSGKEVVIDAVAGSIRRNAKSKRPTNRRVE